MLALAALAACSSSTNRPQQYKAVFGKTMGTTYSIKYQGSENYKAAIDSLLVAINNSVSHYEPNSTISKINQAGASNQVIPTDAHFDTNFEQSMLVSSTSKGAYNPAVMPLVNYYGFGFENVKIDEIDTTKVLKLRELTKLSCFSWSQGKITKSCDGAMLDFSSLAKGYGIDQVAQLLESKGSVNYLVEIGGETYAKGVNEKGNIWRVGVRKPSTNKNQRGSVLKSFELDGRAIATSGNYENYRETTSGKVVAHTINPITGFPQSLDEEILSSTVFAPDCMTADAYATAFKVMGLAESMALAEKLDDIEIFLVYADANGALAWKASEGLQLN